MENNSKFRNHASIILEKSIKVIGTTIVVFLLNILSDLKEVGMSTTDILWLVGVVTVILVVVLGYQAIIWSKTYISIEENTSIISGNDYGNGESPFVPNPYETNVVDKNGKFIRRWNNSIEVKAVLGWEVKNACEHRSRHTGNACYRL